MPTSQVGNSADSAALGAGIELLDPGYWVVPLHVAGSLRPDGRPRTGKEAIGSGWGAARHTPESLRRTFERHPGAGIGLALGPGRAPDGGWLIDLEGDGPEAEESLSRLLGGEVIETPAWESTRGQHHLFVVDGDRLVSLLGAAGATQRRSNSGTWHLGEFPGLEWRTGGFDADGTVKQFQSAIPPTPGTDGRPRRWLTPPRAPIAHLPESAYAALEDLAERKAIQWEGAGSDVTTGPSDARVSKPGPSSPADHTIAPTYGAAALADELRAIALATEGNRHVPLLGSAMRLASLAKAGQLEWHDASQQITEAATGIGLGGAEIRDVLDWAWTKSDPREIAPKNDTHSALGLGSTVCVKTEDTSPVCVNPGDERPFLDCVEARLPDVVIPSEFAGSKKLEPLARVLVAMHQEASRRGRSDFIASSRDIARLAGIAHFKTALRRLERDIHPAGFLSLLKGGEPWSADPRRPNRLETKKPAGCWAWHDPPRPTEAVWNSVAATRKGGRSGAAK